MCDTLVIVKLDRIWFAKNSDRDPNEAQTLYWQPSRNYPSGATLRCTYLDIPQVSQTAAVLLSRPFWMWGAEMGTNEHGVCVGNEAVFTKQPYSQTGLTGMDLVRLGLERGTSARNAMGVIVQLLGTHGQGGGCGLEHRSFTYHNSFLIADSSEAYVLETAGRHWAKERIKGVRSISNGLTIPGFAEQHSDRLRSRVANCRVRQKRTTILGEGISGLQDLMHLLRDHGEQGLRFSWMNGALSGPCAHAGGLIAATQTTASWVAELKPGLTQHWVTATSTPCLSIFKPVSIDQPIDLGPWPTERFDAQHYWWRHERRVRSTLLAPEAIATQRNELERTWLQGRPASSEAFAQAEKWLDAHHRLIQDDRPWFVRRYWAKRNRWAAFDPSSRQWPLIKQHRLPETR
ncbi:MAG TPA: C69 family dipeptidase [Gemmatales bacterium]|nr:C69 family dipeptidase [Gemmatales bacterium]